MSDCIESTGYPGPGGYRMVYSPEAYKLYGKNRSKIYAHREAYCEANGVSLSDIEGKVVRHKCDNRVCVNPDHLVLGSQADNIRDMHDRGRAAVNRCCGARNSNSKLTEEAVRDIRRRYTPKCKLNGMRALAKEYGVHPNIIFKVAKGIAWGHVV